MISKKMVLTPLSRRKLVGKFYGTITHNKNTLLTAAWFIKTKCLEKLKLETSGGGHMVATTKKTTGFPTT
ncbi:MAG: hypothetical protein ACQJCO_03855 [cyanobacterium endosymbiont of Rhopalodia sterrenbergii]